ncbi:transcriptional regulator FtsR [Demequina oxidasica]|uniref:transcriptional regulator FtsR n=1 Tax=Demequina oxidasica TaxID=676199 RepID=UPI0007847B15|nr:MerR family transcriptional regulator [Demequina oxidasica]
MSELRAIASPEPDPTHVAPAADLGTDDSLEGTWPHALSHEPMLRVSDVLAQVQAEFPALSTSKLRFLDNNGLVTPFRTTSGYRQYSPADVERLRFVLRQQRDQYQPLGVIAGHLEALDSGRMRMAVAPRAVGDEADQYLGAGDFAASAGVETDLVEQLDDAGLLTQSVPGRYDRRWLPLATAAQAYLSSGGDLRTLKSLVSSARREADRADAMGQPDKMRGRAGAAEDAANEFAEASIAVFSASVRGQVSR